MENLLDNPPITVILTAYKRPQLIKRAVRSVLNQTYPHFKLCIYDDASNDGTRESVLPFLKDKRVHYHCNEKNVGMLANYQNAFSQVSTPFFCFFSDDDLILPSFLEKGIKAFEIAPEVSLFIGSTVFVTEKGKVIRVPIYQWQKEGVLSPLDAIPEMIGNYPPPTSVLFRREVLEIAKIDFANLLVWDVDFILQTAAHYPSFLSKEELAIFVSHKGSFSGYQSIQKWKQGYSRLIWKFQTRNNLKEEVKEVLLNGLADYLKDFEFSVPYYYLLIKKDFKKAFVSARILRKKYGLNLKNFLLMALAKTCCYFPFLFFFVFLLKHIKNKIKKNRKKTKYRNYAKWLVVE